MFLMGRIGACVVRGQVISTAGYIAVKTIGARGAPRAAATTPQYMTSVQPNLLLTNCLATVFPPPPDGGDGARE